MTVPIGPRTIDPELENDRKEYRHQDRDRRDGVDEAADEQDEQVCEEQEDPLVLCKAEDRIREDLGGLADGQQPREDRGGGFGALSRT